MASFSENNINIIVSTSEACFIHKSGVTASLHVKDVIKSGSRELSRGEVLIWDINNNHLWLVNRSHYTKRIPHNTTVEVLLLIPTIDARLAYLNQLTLL